MINSILKPLFYISVFCLFSFAFVTRADAYTEVIDAMSYTFTANVEPDSALNWTNTYYDAVQSFTTASTTNNISSILLRYDCDSDYFVSALTYTLKLAICSGTPPSTRNTTYPCPGGTLVGYKEYNLNDDEECDADGGFHDNSIYFDEPVIVTANTQYYIHQQVYYLNTDEGHNFEYRYSTSNPYSGGKYYENANLDMPFITHTYQGYIAPPGSTASVYLRYPTEWGVSRNFEWFEVGVTTDEEITECEYINIAVDYAETGTTTMTTVQDTWDYSQLASTTVFSLSIAKPDVLDAGTYYAEVYLTCLTGCTSETDCDYMSIWDSDVTGNYFVITNKAPAEGTTVDDWGLLTSVEDSGVASGTLNVLCVKDDGFMQYSLCMMFKYLFEPSEVITDRIKADWDYFAVRKPFGYYTVYSNRIQTLFVSPGVSPYQLPNNFSNNHIKDIITIILVIMTFIFVLKRLVNINV